MTFIDCGYRNGRALGVRMFAPVDVHVGAAVAAARMAKGLTQSDLGRAIGVTFQQVQKYEKGANRFSASRLYAACEFLGVAVQDVFPASGEQPSELGAADQVFGMRMATAGGRLSASQKTMLAQLAESLVGDKAA